MQQLNVIQAIVDLARDAQTKQTREAVIMLHELPKTPETKELLNRLKIADQKINSQLDFVEKLDRLARKHP